MRRMSFGIEKTKEDIKEGFTDETICGNCGGKCCKRIACAFIPEDFKNIEDAFEGVRQGIYSINIDTFETFNYYVKVRNRYGAPIDFGMTGECKLLHELGCSLDFNNRPYEGRMLKPNSDGKCKSEVSREDLGRAWEPYQKELETLVKEYEFLYSKKRLDDLGIKEISLKINDGNLIEQNLLKYINKLELYTSDFKNYDLYDMVKNVYTRQELNCLCELIMIDHSDLILQLSSSYGLYSKDVLAILTYLVVELTKKEE